ncbi:hypothetical protein [Aliidiomarina halalkaliphila]|nr:hypothetical protein [Aliidiomarina halalkaliphila]
MGFGPILLLVFIPVAVIATIAGYLIWWFNKEEQQRQESFKKED